MPGYHSSVKAHGVLAAIVFLFLVPAAIMVNRFMTSRPALKIRIHIWAQVLTVLLTTVVFVLGYFQVGPRRSFTNPHHGIGLALYVLILVQFIGGWLNYKRNQKKRPMYAPLRLVVSREIRCCEWPQLIFPATSMARSDNCTSRSRADTIGFDALWLAAFFVHSICLGRLHSCACLFRTGLFARTTSGPTPPDRIYV